ncbi:hypothetical protein CCACVL1_06911 [Corchorus capsularis]|uniref:Uncharacterized protein n=1 Tax=Corchorus capsularis TaxID=210143 RepID=A0A1R3JBF5_COCAP|nr:hypothetical protein CCACVL1_06911 [Corchorus capsularis]
MAPSKHKVAPSLITHLIMVGESTNGAAAYARSRI